MLLYLIIDKKALIGNKQQTRILKKYRKFGDYALLLATTGNKQQTGILKINRKVVNYAQHKETMGKVCDFFLLSKYQIYLLPKKMKTGGKHNFVDYIPGNAQDTNCHN